MDGVQTHVEPGTSWTALPFALPFLPRWTWYIAYTKGRAKEGCWLTPVITRDKRGSLGFGWIRYELMSSKVGMGHSLLWFGDVGVYPTALQAFQQQNWAISQIHEISNQHLSDCQSLRTFECYQCISGSHRDLTRRIGRTLHRSTLLATPTISSVFIVFV